MVDHFEIIRYSDETDPTPILENPKSEVYISLMYRDINRFTITSEFISPLDDLSWMPRVATDGKSIGDFDHTREFFYSLYKTGN